MEDYPTFERHPWSPFSFMVALDLDEDRVGQLCTHVWRTSWVVTAASKSRWHRGRSLPALTLRSVLRVPYGLACYRLSLCQTVAAPQRGLPPLQRESPFVLGREPYAGNSWLPLPLWECRPYSQAPRPQFHLCVWCPN